MGILCHSEGSVEAMENVVAVGVAGERMARRESDSRHG